MENFLPAIPPTRGAAVIYDKCYELGGAVRKIGVALKCETRCEWSIESDAWRDSTLNFRISFLTVKNLLCAVHVTGP